MKNRSYAINAANLPQTYGAVLVPYNEKNLDAAQRAFEEEARKSIKKDQEARQKSWLAVRDKPVGC